MKTIEQIKECTGCRACEQICQLHCISFIQDDEGFRFPVIDKDSCVHCGKCYDRCSQKPGGYEGLNTPLQVYAAVHRDAEILHDSSSGGGMSAFAQVILDQGGIVYGAWLDPDDWEAKYIGVDNLSNLSKLRRSKYVQADTGRSYGEICECLKRGQDVLFVGCPCQVAGLCSFLTDEDTAHLYTVDILCHGVPSPEFFKGYIKYLEKKHKKTAVGFSFRDKTKFGNKSALKYVFDGLEKTVLGKCDPYYMAFRNGCANRMCCYKCQYARKERIGDISLGDYWGIKDVHPDFNDIDGVSLVLVNTKKGEDLFKVVKLDSVPSTLEHAGRKNGILTHPSSMAHCRKYFYQDIKEYGYERALRKNVKVLPDWYNTILVHLPNGVISVLSRIKK